MKEGKIVLVVLAIGLIMLWLREDRIDFSLLDLLPFFSDRPIDVYDFGGLAMVAVALVAVGRMLRR